MLALDKNSGFERDTVLFSIFTDVFKRGGDLSDA